MMYGISDYDAMIADDIRTRAYVAAIGAAVRPGDVVIEIGTGFGFFAVAACRAGARRVYAIESDPVSAIAPEFLAANACSDRVTVLHGDSRRLSLPESGDVLLEDLRGVLPLFGSRISTLVDARTRLLRPGARFVAQRDSIWAAPTAADAKFAGAHIAPGDAPFGIDRRVVAARVRQDWHRARLSKGALFAPPALLATLDLATVADADVDGRAEWTVAHDGTLDGIAVWFDATLAGDHTISNAPSAPPALYGQAFLPLERSLSVFTGDTLSMHFRAKLIDDEYLFSWDTAFDGVDGSRARFRQSNLGAMSLRRDALHRRHSDFTPIAGAAQERLERLLSLVDGRRSAEAIAAELRSAFPQHFTTANAALAFTSATLGALADAEASDG